jgi:surface carbohydrate biosynthesis protein
MSSRINFLFPIEVINREIDFRLWLAVLVAKPTNRIFIGYHDVIYRLGEQMRGGVYVGKNLFLTSFPTDLSRYQRLKRNGFSLVHLDEEGATAGESEDLWRYFLDLRLDPGCLSGDDYICTWGDFQRDHYSSLRPDLASHVRSTGHPRFDLYKPEHREYFSPEVSSLRSRFGDFVLINTNLGHANGGLGLKFTFGEFDRSGFNTYGYNPNEATSRVNHFRGWSHQMHTLSNLVRLVNALSMEFPAINFVIRPHPAEDWTMYEQLFQGIGNVHVVHEGPVAPWLLASRLLIQEGCMTAIEAYLAGTPVINYDTHTTGHRWKNQFLLANQFGIKLTSEQEVIDAVHEMATGPVNGAKYWDLDPIVPHVMENFKADSLSATVAVLTEAEGRQHERASAPSALRIHTDEALRSAVFGGKALIRPLFPWKNRMYKFFTTNCFYGLDRGSIEAKLRTIQSMTGKPVRAKFFSQSLMSLELDQ